MNSHVFRIWIPILLGAALCFPAAAQRQEHLQRAPDLAAPEGIAEAKAMVADILSRQPEQNLTNSGLLVISRNRNVERKEVRFSTVADGPSWVSLYTANGPKPEDNVTLKILHRQGKTNEYWLQRGAGEAQRLSRDQLSTPFADSDFWVGDLGLQFLHWDKQRVIRKQMKRGQMCNVLESINPSPSPAGYSRVVSWIDIDSGGIVQADAFDAHGRLLKQFEPKEFSKVKGRWELERMEIRNRQTGSTSSIQFHLAQ